MTSWYDQSMSFSISILKVCPLTLDLIVELQLMSGHIPHLFPLHVETAENPLCLLLNVEPADGEVGVIRLRDLNLRGERSTLGEEKSLLLLKVDDGKVTVVIEGNLKGVSLIRGDLKNAIVR